MLFLTAEYAIRFEADDVVEAVENRGRQDAHEDRHLPRPPKLGGDEERSPAPVEHPSMTRPIVRQNGKRSQFVRVTAATLDRGSSSWALQRREGKHRAVIVLEEELEQTAAQPADAIEEDEMGAFRNRWYLRG